ncbi:MAG: F0F1 ATP synthase subunit A [Candidatus Sumerlaeaceae bacterium]|nr:F0F1 ATP synthase subunit A [Candidatus Sumerlaeaceae bacterium]
MSRMVLAACVVMLVFASGMAAAGGAGGHGEGGGAAEPGLPNLITVALALGGPEFAQSKVGHFLHEWEYQIFMVLITALLCGFLVATARLRQFVPTRMQALLEIAVEGFYNFVTGLLGKHNAKHVPFIGCLFLFIWFNNLFGLVPLFTGATSKFQTTIALALVVFFYIHIYALKDAGLRYYLWHMAGSPDSLVGWCLAPLLFILEVIGKLVQPLSLALRLYGNLTGEHILSGVFLLLGMMLAGAFMPHPPVGVPLHLPFLFLGLLVGTIQALVFTLLSTIYLMMLLPHDDHHDHEEAHAHAGAAH